MDISRPIDSSQIAANQVARQLSGSGLSIFGETLRKDLVVVWTGEIRIQRAWLCRQLTWQQQREHHRFLRLQWSLKQPIKSELSGIFADEHHGGLRLALFIVLRHHRVGRSSCRCKKGRVPSARPRLRKASSFWFYWVTAAVKLVIAPVAGTFRVSSGKRELLRCGSPLVPVLPRTE